MSEFVETRGEHIINFKDEIGAYSLSAHNYEEEIKAEKHTVQHCPCFKYFVFEQSELDNEIEKYLNFWKAVMEKKLQPIKCNIIERTKKDQVAEKAKEEEILKKCDEKVEDIIKQIHLKYTDLWLSVLKDMQRKRLDKIKARSQVPCNICNSVNRSLCETGESKMKAEIRELKEREPILESEIGGVNGFYQKKKNCHCSLADCTCQCNRERSKRSNLTTFAKMKTLPKSESYKRETSKKNLRTKHSERPSSFEQNKPLVKQLLSHHGIAGNEEMEKQSAHIMHEWEQASSSCFDLETLNYTLKMQISSKYSNISLCTESELATIQEKPRQTENSDSSLRMPAGKPNQETQLSPVRKSDSYEMAITSIKSQNDDKKSLLKNDWKLSKNETDTKHRELHQTGLTSEREMIETSDILHLRSSADKTHRKTSDNRRSILKPPTASVQPQPNRIEPFTKTETIQKEHSYSSQTEGAQCLFVPSNSDRKFKQTRDSVAMKNKLSASDYSRVGRDSVAVMKEKILKSKQ